MLKRAYANTADRPLGGTDLNRSGERRLIIADWVIGIEAVDFLNGVQALASQESLQVASLIQAVLVSCQDL